MTNYYTHPTVQPIKEFWNRYFQYHYEKYNYGKGTQSNSSREVYQEDFDERGFMWYAYIWSEEFDYESDYVFVAEDEERMAKLSYYKGRKKWRELGGSRKFIKEHPDDILDRFQEKDGLYWAAGGHYWDKHMGYEGEYDMGMCCNCGDYPDGFMITSGQGEFWNYWDLDEDEQRGEQYVFNCLECYYNRLVATKIIQKAWKKCRWNPEYKMCEKVQLRNLEIETGVKL